MGETKSQSGRERAKTVTSEIKSITYDKLITGMGEWEWDCHR